MFEPFNGLIETEADERASLSVGEGALANRFSVFVRNFYTRGEWDRVAENVSAVRWAARRMSDAALREHLRSYRRAPRAQVITISRMLAVLVEARTRSGGYAPTFAELVAAVAILDRGVAQVATPSSRAVSAGLAAAVAAVFGRRVHVLAQDEDRAARMAMTVRGTLEYMGIGMGVMQASLAPSARRLQLSQPIVFSAVSQIAKDYLAAVTDPNVPASEGLHHIDALARGRRGPRGMPVAPDFAIVDAIDVLLCEGGTARLLGPARVEEEPASALIEQAYGLADELHDGRDFSRGRGLVELTSAGEVRVGLIGRVLGPPWQTLPFNRQLNLVRRALDARGLGDRDYHVVDGEIAPLTEAATAAFGVEPDRDPSVKDFLTARDHRSDRTHDFSTRISICRFAHKYRRLGGTIAFSSCAAPELASRFALACAAANGPGTLRLRTVADRTEVDRLLVSEARSAIDRGASLLVMAAQINQAATVVQTLTAAGIESVQLQGSPSEADADLVAEALRRSRSVVVMGTGREVGRMRELSGPNDLRPRLLVLGIENFGAMPNALAGSLPLQEFESASLAVGSVDKDMGWRWLAGIERRILERLTMSDRRLAQRLGWFLLRSACVRAARRRRRARTTVYRHEDQQIAALAFVGAASRGL